MTEPKIKSVFAPCPFHTEDCHRKHAHVLCSTDHSQAESLRQSAINAGLIVRIEGKYLVFETFKKGSSVKKIDVPSPGFREKIYFEGKRVLTRFGVEGKCVHVRSSQVNTIECKCDSCECDCGAEGLILLTTERCTHRVIHYISNHGIDPVRKGEKWFGRLDGSWKIDGEKWSRDGVHIVDRKGLPDGRVYFNLTSNVRKKLNKKGQKTFGRRHASKSARDRVVINESDLYDTTTTTSQ